MKISKFKRGDLVRTKGASEAKVTKVWYSAGVPKIDIEYPSSKLTSTFDEDELTLLHQDLEGIEDMPKVLGSKCPKCGTPWTKTKFGFKEWLDCKPCEKTAEQLVKEDREGSKQDDFGTYGLKNWGGL